MRIHLCRSGTAGWLSWSNGEGCRMNRSIVRIRWRLYRAWSWTVTIIWRSLLISWAYRTRGRRMTCWWGWRTSCWLRRDWRWRGQICLQRLWIISMRWIWILTRRFNSRMIHWHRLIYTMHRQIIALMSPFRGWLLKIRRWIRSNRMSNRLRIKLNWFLLELIRWMIRLFFVWWKRCCSLTKILRRRLINWLPFLLLVTSRLGKNLPIVYINWNIMTSWAILSQIFMLSLIRKIRLRLNVSAGFHIERKLMKLRFTFDAQTVTNYSIENAFNARQCKR